MKRNSKGLVAGAAMAGLLTGVVGRAYASSPMPSTRDARTSTSRSVWGQLDQMGDKGQHACKGQNDCKGQGGCKSGDNGCKGENSCKGHGGCNTMPKG